MTTVPPIPDPPARGTAAEDEAAGHAVRRHATKGQWSGEELLQVMQMLGLEPYESGGRTSATDGRNKPRKPPSVKGAGGRFQPAPHVAADGERS